MAPDCPRLREALSRHRPLVVAHRGASGEAPENTFAAFELALAQGAHAIELDLRLSRDGVPLVIHDATLERTTTGTGPVSARHLEELRALDAGSWFGEPFRGQRIPTLEEVLEWARGRTFLLLELKAGHPSLAEAVARLVQQLGMEGEVEVFSFDPRLARRAGALLPGTLTGICYYRPPAPHLLDTARRTGVGALHPHWASLRPQYIEEAHHHDLLVLPWTVNNGSTALRLAQWGADALVTDYPGRILHALGVTGPVDGGPGRPGGRPPAG